MKKLVSALLLAGVTSVAAAQTSLYGLADAYYGQTSAKTSTNQVSSGGMSTSYIGFKSVEAVGPLQASVVLETFLRPDTAAQGRFNGDTFYARNAYVALGSKVGEVQLGRVTTPYFISTVAFNSFGDSFTFSPMVTQRFGVNNFNLAAGGVDSGWNNAVQVKTNVAGLTVSGVYSAGIVDDATGTKQAGKSVGAMYFGGPVGLTATWQDVEQGLGKPSMTSVILGGSYDLKLAKVYAQWNRVHHSDLVTKEDKGWSLGAAMPLGAGNTAMVSISKFDHAFVGNKSADTASWAVGLQHSLSKRTDLYAAVRDTNYTNDGVNRTNVAWVDTRVTGVGIRHRF
ncbi:MAG: porin [Chitinophagia bacterium]|nr:porin [Chitinophagia bacterium]